MAEFTSSDFPVAGGDPNQFAISQRNSLASLTADQDLQDRATFRTNALGMLAGDPTATGQAMGANPTAAQGYLNSLPNAGVNMRAQADSDQAALGSLSAATLNAPPDQRAAVWSMGRQALINGGHQVAGLPADYPGDTALQATRAMGLSVPEQLKYTPQPLSANPAPLLQSVPGGGFVGPGGASASSGAMTATPLSPPGQTDPDAGPSPNFAPRMIGVESGGKANAQNPMSSAGGPGQFINSTWLSLLPQVRPDLAQGRTPEQQLALKSDPAVSAQMVNGYARQNAPKLAAAGLPVNDTTLALAHRFGPDMAIQVASAPPGTPIAGIVGPQVMAVNPDLRGQTAGSIAGFYAQRVGGGAGVRTQVAANVPPGGLATDASGAPAPQPAQVAQPRPNGLLPVSQSPAPAVSVDPGAPPPPHVPAPPGGGYAPQPTPDSPHDTPDASNAIAVDSLDAARGLPFGTRVRLPDGSVQFTGNAGVPASAAPQAAPGPVGGLDSASGRIPMARADERFGPAPVQQNPLAGLVAPALPASPNNAVVGTGSGRFPMRGTGTPSASLPNGLLATTTQPPAPAIGAPPLANQPPQGGVQPPVPPASTAADQAVQQATAELGGSLQGMSPEAQNTAIVQRAQQIMAQGQPPQAAPPLVQSVRAATPSYPFARDRMTGAYVPVPEQPGFAYAIAPNGQPVAQMIPGAPGAGVETKVTPTGDVVTSNKSTGQYSVDRGVLPNTARIGQVNDGSAVHVLQPGSGEIGSFPLQANTPKIQADMYAEDRKSQAQQIDVAQQSQQQQVRLLEARQAMQGLPTGSGGEARTAWANWAETYLPPAWAAQLKAKLNLPDAVPGQEFAKLMTQSAGQQERAVAGARGGIGMMTLFKNNNPGLEMQPGANQDLLNAQLVATQADADYAKGYVNFVNDQGQKLVNRQGYTPASQFDQSWLQQRNPQVYTAAAEAMSGKPFAFWSKGLTPAEGRRALQIVGGIDPTVIAQGSAGPLPVRQFMGAQ